MDDEMKLRWIEREEKEIFHVTDNLYRVVKVKVLQYKKEDTTQDVYPLAYTWIDVPLEVEE